MQLADISSTGHMGTHGYIWGKDVCTVSDLVIIRTLFPTRERVCRSLCRSTYQVQLRRLTVQNASVTSGQSVLTHLADGAVDQWLLCNSSCADQWRNIDVSSTNRSWEVVATAVSW
ncbi:hypothetical protein LSAT2_003121 [Lamellibrachia satsuma]|nr:hypothetical protein LSAT2_003121 [Lamellibrachia satsuma]